MLRFKVMDTETGREVSADKIEKIAKDGGLMDMDIDQFFIGEDGQLVLADDCGKVAYCDADELGFIPVLDGKYPDIEYLERVFRAALRKEHPEIFEISAVSNIELEAAFSQIWPNTACGFSEPGMVSGQAFTTEITTVLKVETYPNCETYYGVFFGNKPAYMVEQANDVFLEDLKNHNFKSVYEAKKVY